MDFVVRMVSDNKYIPIIKNENGNEVYRGEFCKTPQEALDKAVKVFETQKEYFPR